VHIEWDAQITRDEPGRQLAWHSLPHAQIAHAGVLADTACPRTLRKRHELFSARERPIMTLVTADHLHKQIAGERGISMITVKAHRGRAMRQMQAASSAQLVANRATEKQDASSHQRVAQQDGSRAPVRVIICSCLFRSRAPSN
jgi:DNA-binding NarL/FixJ family response regulator